jgi:hypothetical protein
VELLIFTSKTSWAMEIKIVYLVYRTDSWHSLNSRELVYIGEDMEVIIAQLKAYRGMTEDDANEIRSILQTQCNNRDYEWEFEAQQINAFAG